MTDTAGKIEYVAAVAEAAKRAYERLSGKPWDALDQPAQQRLVLEAMRVNGSLNRKGKRELARRRRRDNGR